MKEKFYITTAIAYTSKTPHIGNTYEAVLADAIARFKRQIGYDVFFLTGTDEHGQKIENQAKEMGIAPKEHVDNIAAEVKEIWDFMGTSYDKFIRTTDNYHEATVQKIFKKLYKQGDIYKGSYEGWYCTSCESFYTEGQLKEGQCPDCGDPVDKAKEEAYFLKLSKYQDRLMKHIEDNPQFIQPESRKNEMVNNFIKPGLQDLCVSRTSFTWGVPVTFDEKHVVYVWIDALSNYITGLGYDTETNSANFNKYWPADVHLIGKDILRFHTIYWPIMLMALDVELPKQIFGHPWLLQGTDKMSKSKGNVIYARQLVEHFGVDAVRYYLLHEMPFANDGSLTYSLLIERINAELANILGNLVNRTIAMSKKYFGSKILAPTELEDIDKELMDLALSTPSKLVASMEELKVADAISHVFELLRRSNKYIDETYPWLLAKDESKKARLGTVLYNLLESIRFSSVMLSSFMPETSEKIFKQLNTIVTDWDSLRSFDGMKPGDTLGEGEILFARIDAEKKLAEIDEENEKNAPKDDIEIESKPEITIDDFDKIDIRVGKVLECKKLKKAKKLLVSKVKIGNQVRQIVSGIANYYAPEDMVGKDVMVIINLKPVKLCGELSEGMILAAQNEDGGLVVCSPESQVTDGCTVS